MARQRIRVEGRDAQIVLAIGAASGVVAASAGASPTGSWIDPVLVTLGVLGAVWAAASAPWWAGVVAAAIGAAFAPDWWLIAVAIAASWAGLWVGLARRSLPWSRALVAGIAAQVLARLGSVEFFGFTAIIAIVSLLAVTVLGARRRPRKERKLIYLVLGGLGALVLLFSLGFALAAASARPHLEQGNDAARQGIDLLSDGDFTGARDAFARASSQFQRADSSLGRPWGMPAALVPVLAQHRESATLLAGEGADVTAAIADALNAVDYDKLRVVNGAIDVAAIRALQQPLAELNAAVDELQTAVLDAASPWLVSAISSRLDDLLGDIAEQRVQLANAQAAIENAPAMLGAEGRRVYFIAFTTPSEARGLGGFMGNWAEMTITDGRIEMTNFGRTRDLNLGGAGEKTLTTLPADYLQRYAGFLLSDPTVGLVGPDAWSNITGSSHFPSVAATMAELYPQSGGTAVDGVIVMDVKSVAKLMEITGDVALPDGTVLQAADAEEFLLSGQYVEDGSQAERIDLLETVARATVDQLLTSSLPSPPELGDMFGPLARGGHLAAWAVRPEEQDVFQRVNMAGLLPLLDGADGLAISFNNASGNKIDYYLDGQVTYDVTVDREADLVRGTVRLVIRNTSPTSGRPEYVIGNQVGEPVGTNITFLTIYTGLPVTGYTVDGQPGEFSVGSEQGYAASSTYLAIPAGASTTVELTVEGTIPDDVDYRLTVSNLPYVRPLPIDVIVNGTPQATITEPGVTRIR